MDECSELPESSSHQGYSRVRQHGKRRKHTRERSQLGFSQPAAFSRVLNGEDYTLFNKEVQQMRLQVGQYPDPDLRFGNPGITVLWVK